MKTRRDGGEANHTSATGESHVSSGTPPMARQKVFSCSSYRNKKFRYITVRGPSGKKLDPFEKLLSQ